MIPLKRFAFQFAIGSFLVLLVVAAALSNGGKAKKNVLDARVRSGEGYWFFSCEIVPIQYRLNTIRNKYKLIQIRIQNEGGNTLQLSRNKDTAEILTGGRSTAAIIDIGANDSQFWDSLDSDIRNILAYPSKVEKGEEESVFLFVRGSDMKSVPDMIRYKIAGIESPVTLRASVAAAKQ
jgi:hypothetical protein